MHGGLSPDLNSMEQIRRVMRPTDVSTYSFGINSIPCKSEAIGEHHLLVALRALQLILTRFLLLDSRLRSAVRSVVV